METAERRAERLEARLREYLDGSPVWPTAEQWKADGQWSLLTMLSRYGGVKYWRARVAVAANHAPGYGPGARVWADERIERTLRAYVDEHGHWPTIVALDAMGGIRDAMKVRGMDAWYVAVGQPPKAVMPRFWTNERIEGGLRLLYSLLGRWPTGAEFDEVAPRLHRAASKHGGLRAWRANIEGQPNPPAIPSSAPERSTWPKLLDAAIIALERQNTATATLQRQAA